MKRPKSIKPVWNCKLCTLHKTCSRPVWGRGPKRPLFIFVGEGPGPEEDRTGIPFYENAPAGGIITNILEELNVKRSEVYFTNATRCFNGFKQEVGVKEIKACKPYLTDELKKVKCKYVVLAGNAALKAVLGHEGITKEHGLLRRGPEGRFYFPVLHPASAVESRFPENRKRIKEALANLLVKIRGDKDPLKEIKCRIIRTPEQFDKFEKKLKSLSKETLVVSDYETNSKKTPFHVKDYIVSGASFAWNTSGGYYLPIDHQNPANILTGETYKRAKDLIRWYARSEFPKANQNIKYEYGVTRGYFGARMQNVKSDPMLQSHLIRPDPGTHGLDKLAYKVGMGGYDQALEDWFTENKIKEKQRNYTKVPIEVIAPYSVADAVCVLKYHDYGMKILEKRKQDKFYFNHVMRGVVPYADLELRGILLDRKYMKKLGVYYVEYSKVLRKRMRRILVGEGIDLPDGFSFNSPEQMAKVMHPWFKMEKYKVALEKTVEKALAQGKRRYWAEADSKKPIDHLTINKNGLISTDKEMVNNLLVYYDITDSQREFLLTLREYRPIQKRYTSNVKGMLKVMCWDGRVRSSLLLHGTATSRRASREPNIQNFPRDAIIKRIFVACEDYLFVMFDYKNLEVRIAAALSNDKELLRAFNSGKDVHSYVASIAYGLDYDKMIKVISTKEDIVRKSDNEFKRSFKKHKTYRENAKVISWVILFGGGAPKIAAGAGIPLEAAEKLLQRVLGEFSGLEEMFEDFHSFADRHGYARTDFGRRRYLHGLDSTSVGVYNAAIRESMNTPIQGTAADITFKAVTKLHHAWRKRRLKAHNVQEVHDAVAIEAFYKTLFSVITIGKRVMESIECPSSAGKIKFEVDSLIGSHLGAKRKIDDEVLEMAKKDPRGLYELCRQDLTKDPTYYADVA